ncbi:hypothetical protein AB1Y20_005657 [Prymnesium parvum]|uniref:DUS-like FMN-binding domain-containing protein n=1 Tax=Prymnesium parvum TaxID=97485 RepID=A0AB34J6D9_PRYPA
MVSHLLLAVAAWRFHVAPMQCYTSPPLRFLFRQLNVHAVLWTEMEKPPDLLASDEAMARRLDPPGAPAVLQLGGDDGALLSLAASRASTRFPFEEINLNCGCPSIESGGAAYGASLMARPTHTRELLEAMALACPDVPLSVKCRLAAHAAVNPDGSLPDERYEDLHSFVHEVSRSGAISHVVVHARAAILSGLSSRSNRAVPTLRPQWVHQLAVDFPQLRVTLNGGIQSVDEVEALRRGGTRLDGVMAGRWLLRDPLALWDLRESCAEGRRGEGRRSVADAIGTYDNYAWRQLQKKGGCSAAELALPLLLLSESMREAEREDDGEGAAAWDALWEAAERIVHHSTGERKGGPRTARQLSRLLARASGSKVSNKLRRNRSEDVGVSVS